MRRGDLFVLSWESLRRVEWGKVAGSGVKSVVIVLLALSFRSFAFVQVCRSSKYG